MSTNKMLIDASHPEETRVAVVRGNRIEEFDFESQEKKQLRGNIYLAKVTRVEPSLQAAFVDYGGNRHGFLAFTEIHPDYYQIPVADRQALLDEEAAEARANRDEDDADEEKAPAKKTGKPKRRSRKAKAETTGEDAPVEAADSDEPKEEKPEEVAADAVEGDAQPDASEDEDDGSSNTIAAVVETDSISEPLPGEDDENADSDSDEAVEAEEKPAKPKRRTTRRKPAKAKKEEVAEEDVVKAESPDVTEPEAELAAKSESEADSQEEAAPAAKPKRSRSRSRKKSKPEAEVEAAGDENGDDDTNGDDVESVGQEDAMEEVPERRRNRRQYKIQEVIKRRQVLLVQVVKEERGTKGAALTTYMSLAGRYSVLMPNTARGGGISRKISNANDRKRLKTIASELEVPEGMGVILRTAGASRTKAEIKRDFEYLMRLWEQVRNLTLSSSAPCLVYEEGSLIKRSIRDLYDKDTGEVLVAGEEGYNEAREFMGMLIPSHVKNVKSYTDPETIFSKFGVESHLDRMLSPQVTLKSGGYLVMNQTEALVAIDVNSGRATREHSIEDTALKTNLEAAEEVARQLRLRDLAGLIVIDFIDMEERRNNRSVEKKLKECLKNDRARIQVGRISHFGLMEMSRQRIRASVLESTMNVCPHCGGQGHIRSDSAIALHIFRGIEEHIAKHNRFDAIVKTNPEIAIQILNVKRTALMELESRYGLKIQIEGDHAIKGQEFTIEKGAAAQGDASAPVGRGQDQQTSGAIDSEALSEDGKASKKRGRGRRRNRDGEEDTGEISEASSENEDNGDEEPRRRRRRGKRGGRKNRGQNGGNEEVAADSTADAQEGTQAGTASEAVVEPADISANEAEPAEKPNSRNRRPRKPKTAEKAPVEETVAAEAPSESVAEAAPVEEAVAEERPTRARNTKRPRKPKKTSEGSSGSDTDKPESDGTTSNDEASKRDGLLSGGGDFF